MSNKERAIELLNQVPDYKMGYVLAYSQGITADEEADDIFFQRMRSGELWKQLSNFRMGRILKS